MKTRLLLLTAFLLASSCRIFAQSTSPNPNPRLQSISAPRALPANSSQVITFSEYTIGTTITDQYKQIGVIFESGAFISTDGSNPTSPVISGTPRFEGPITGRFVVPGTNKPVAVKSFTFDAGYFDNFTSTRIEWFDLKGQKLGQRINSTLGIEQFTIEGGNIASWTMSIVADEPAGFAIDNISFVSTGPSILFRESVRDVLAGRWGEGIPGFDHVGFQIGNKVYESTPSYDPLGIYISEDGKEQVNIVFQSGVQSQHTLGTFKYNYPLGGPYTFNVEEFEEIPIDDGLANKMLQIIEKKLGSPFINVESNLIKSLLPSNQKGGNGAFTCVGLVERAAEDAGHNGGQGFIPNIFESFFITPLLEVNTLSPGLLNYAMKNQQLLSKAEQWVLGFFDPVDFIITDPLGRRIGFAQGISYNEIPNAFYPGDGQVEQFLISQAVPGVYKIRLIGKGTDAFAAVGAKDASESFSGMLTDGQVVEKTIFVKPTPNCMGDVNGDGALNSADVTALNQKLNRFTDGLGDPGDLNGDGLLSTIDVDLLKKLIGLIDTPFITINPSTPVAVFSGAPVSLTAIPTGFTPTDYVWSSIPEGFSGAGASLTVLTQNAPSVSTNTTYTISVVATNGPTSLTASVNILVKALSPPSEGQLTLLAPMYNCATGAFTFNTSGGDGSPITFSAIGITGSTTNPNQFVDQELRTAADAPLILLSATQNGVTVTYSWNIRAVCPLTPGPGGDALTLLAPTYNCATGAFTFNTSGGDGSPVSFSAIGITGPTTNPNQFVDEALRTAADAPLIILTATQNGVTVTYSWNIRAVCPLTPGPGGDALTLLAPTYNCATGAFTFNTSGGNGATTEYRAVPGITGWTTNPDQFVDEGSRTANDVQPFLLQARQNGVETTLIWDLKAACSRARQGASESLTGMKVSVLGNPVAGETVEVEVSGVEQQPLHLQLSNLQGQLVSEQQIKQAAAIERVRLQLSRSTGVYLLQVSSPGQTKVVRVLKVN
jgi:hypothetical protein